MSQVLANLYFQPTSKEDEVPNLSVRFLCLLRDYFFNYVLVLMITFLCLIGHLVLVLSM